jgi:hypothetical protein
MNATCQLSMIIIVAVAGCCCLLQMMRHPFQRMKERVFTLTATSGSGCGISFIHSSAMDVRIHEWRVIYAEPYRYRSAAAAACSILLAYCRLSSSTFV